MQHGSFYQEWGEYIFEWQGDICRHVIHFVHAAMANESSAKA
jgi:hypothetical protein